MKDRFRFRVWHIPTKEMLFVLDIGNYFVQATPSLAVISARTIRTKDCILEQCTGLKDKNGNLIYEGDIVKVAQLSTNLPVVYYQKFAMFELISNKYLVSLHGSDENLEVIGNIHKNPELLEGK